MKNKIKGAVAVCAMMGMIGSAWAINNVFIAANPIIATPTITVGGTMASFMFNATPINHVTVPVTATLGAASFVSGFPSTVSVPSSAFPANKVANTGYYHVIYYSGNKHKCAKYSSQQANIEIGLLKVAIANKNKNQQFQFSVFAPTTTCATLGIYQAYGNPVNLTYYAATLLVTPKPLNG